MTMCEQDYKKIGSKQNGMGTLTPLQTPLFAVLCGPFLVPAGVK